MSETEVTRIKEVQAALKRKEYEQQDFFQKIVHELRTPLHGITHILRRTLARVRLGDHPSAAGHAICLSLSAFCAVISIGSTPVQVWAQPRLVTKPTIVVASERYYGCRNYCQLQRSFRCEGAREYLPGHFALCGNYSTPGSLPTCLAARCMRWMLVMLANGRSLRSEVKKITSCVRVLHADFSIQKTCE